VTRPLSAFSGFGIEIEYMIVDATSLGVAALADRVLEDAAGEITGETVEGALAWSNELALHVIELKTNGPAPELSDVPGAFAAGVARVNALLAPRGARLMPGAAHPWMNPDTDTKLWPHDDDTIYRVYDRIFGCRGHGWSNLQSMHVNLPFADDREFARLHAAIRAVLPILPALAASSPYLDGAFTSRKDARLATYAKNQARVPEITGQVIPEPIGSEQEYRERVLAPIYRAIAPHDPDRILQHEWLNSRGAIARFDRNAIEIRVLDTQEHPGADLAIAALVVDLVQRLYEGDERVWRAANAIPTVALAALFDRCVDAAEEATIDDGAYLDVFGIRERSLPAGELWRRLAGTRTLPVDRAPIDTILRQGTLSSRLVRAAGTRPTRADLAAAYRRLCDCLAEGKSF
jgi:gamma-glutamyl:cysteine ligase YbdK (ATP-grasp superfamily)